MDHRQHGRKEREKYHVRDTESDAHLRSGNPYHLDDRELQLHLLHYSAP